MATHVKGEPNFQEGLWEMTMSATMKGLDETMPPMKATSCMTMNDLSPAKFHPEGDCKVSNVKTRGDSVTWTVSCKGEDGLFQGTGTMVYKATSLEGNTTSLERMGTEKART